MTSEGILAIVIFGGAGYAAGAYLAFRSMALQHKRQFHTLPIELIDVAALTFFSVIWPVGWPLVTIIGRVMFPREKKRSTVAAKVDAWATRELDS